MGVRLSCVNKVLLRACCHAFARQSVCLCTRARQASRMCMPAGQKAANIPFQVSNEGKPRAHTPKCWNVIH